MALTKVTNPLLSATGTADATTFLRGDETWAAVDSFPAQGSSSGKFLTTDGSDVSWGTVSSGTIPFYKADGSADNINLTSSGEIPFAKANGTTDNIALII